jgi:glycolate oxidase
MANLNPQALEFMEKEIVLSSERYIGKSVFPQKIDGIEAGAYLLVTFEAKDEDELNDLIDEASELVLETGAIDVLIADTPSKMKDAWAARSSFLEAIMAETTLLDECDVVVPITQDHRIPHLRKCDGERVRSDHQAASVTPETEICTSMSAATT